MRRQTATSGINPAGSSRALRLDPLSLPVSFDAHDIRADGGVRQNRTSSRTRRAAPCRARHADGDQRSRQRFSRRRAARHRRCPDAGAGSSRSVLDDSACASVPTATRSRPPGRCGATSSRCRNCRKTRRASPRRGAGVTTRSGRGVRNSWCGGAAAICSIRRTSIRASARSSRGIERGGVELPPAAPHRRAIPQTATAPHRGWI